MRQAPRPIIHSWLSLNAGCRGNPINTLDGNYRLALWHFSFCLRVFWRPFSSVIHGAAGFFYHLALARF